MRTSIYLATRYRFTFLLLIVVVLLCSVQPVVANARINRVSVWLIHSLNAESSTTGVPLPCQANEPMVFPEMVLGLRQLDKSDYAAEMLCFHQQKAYLNSGRQAILAVLEAETSWKFGFHTQACRQLYNLGANRKIIQLAQQSANQRDYETTALYLSCLDWSWGNTSHPVAMLYRQLGIYYKERGLSAQAFQAYEQAAIRYPGVWAEPYIVQSDMLWQQNQREAAIRLLEDALARSTQATATYQLARTLGLRLQEIGQLRSAYCAMQKAIQVQDQVPLKDAPQPRRADLRERAERLRGIISPGASPNQRLCD